MESADQLCKNLGYELINYAFEDAEGFTQQARLAAEGAVKDGGLMIVAGGDGTVRGAAQAACGKPVRFAVVPCGTFNFFARAHRIPEDPIEAFKGALLGTPRKVRLGQVNDHVFLINASLGLYARAIREREKRTSKFGRRRFVVILSTVISMLSNRFLLTLRILIEGQEKIYRTATLFVGNNALQLRDLALRVSRCMREDSLALILLKPITKFEALRIVLRGIFRTLDQEEKLETFCVDRLDIDTPFRHVEVALDGELFRMRSPLRIQSLPEALQLVIPSTRES